jgi:hypothetical protein
MTHAEAAGQLRWSAEAHLNAAKREIYGALRGWATHYVSEGCDENEARVKAKKHVPGYMLDIIGVER